MLKLFIFIGVFASNLLAQEIVPTITVSEDEELTPLTPYATTKIENVSKEKFSQPNRQSIADMVKDQVGVESQTYCSNCGAKRLTINGLKAEHTSLLIDGLPLHSAVSSFYGVDSVPVNGIENIEVMRGTGASLTNPEAIGGTINMITIDPLVKKQTYNTSVSINNQGTKSGQNHSVLVSIPNKDKTFGLSLGGQFTESNAWDEDDNGVAEAPDRNNKSALVKTRFFPNNKNDIKLRLGYSDLTIIGGAVNGTKPDNVRETPAQDTDFEDGNVEKNYIGDPERITDWISLKRYESTLHWTHYLGQNMTLDWNSGYARQEQQAIYQHGFDYAHNDNLFVTDLSLQKALKNNHLLKIGYFHKLQMLRSASEVLFEEKGIPKDHFDHSSHAVYANYTYIVSDSLEMDMALRVDQISVNWLELSNEVNETVVAPRFQLRHDIDEHISQRFSYGLGYRAPLTFFESQHGNEENGYQVDIEELEKAHSLVYSISKNTPTYYLTYGLHYTYLQNMAFGFESQGNPIFYRNSETDYEIWATDLLVGYKVNSKWMLETSLEYFKYQDGYTAKLPTAAIEERLQLKSTYTTDKWQHFFSAALVGARELFRYGRYSDHLVDRNQSTVPESRGNEEKDRYAPAYLVVDTSLNYNFTKSQQFSFGINNLLDQTQTSLGENPSAWHWHFDHAHYDGLHTWGPNRGREFYLKYTLAL